jgi:hypothetical protein
MNETITRHDERLDPGARVLGVAAGGQAAAVTLDDLHEIKQRDIVVGGQKVEITYDVALQTGRARLQTGDQATTSPLLWQCCYWYAWSQFYPQTQLITR